MSGTRRHALKMLGTVTDDTRTAPDVPGLTIEASQDLAAIHGVLNEAFVGHYLRNKEYNPDPYQQLLLDARSHVERLILLYYRLLARIISILRQVEAAVD